MENTTMVFVAIVVFCLILFLPLKESKDSVTLPVMCIFQEAENQQCQSKAESDPYVAQKSNVSWHIIPITPSFNAFRCCTSWWWRWEAPPAMFSKREPASSKSTPPSLSSTLARLLSSTRSSNNLDLLNIISLCSGAGAGGWLSCSDLFHLKTWLRRRGEHVSGSGRSPLKVAEARHDVFRYVTGLTRLFNLTWPACPGWRREW